VAEKKDAGLSREFARVKNRDLRRAPENENVQATSKGGGKADPACLEKNTWRQHWGRRGGRYAGGLQGHSSFGTNAKVAGVKTAAQKMEESKSPKGPWKGGGPIKEFWEEKDVYAKRLPIKKGGHCRAKSAESNAG